MKKVLLKKTEQGRVAHIQLNLPEKRNILSLEVIKSLSFHLNVLKEDPDLQLLILSGSGRHFCAGGDLRWMRLKSQSSDVENLNQVKLLSKMLYDFYDFPLPVIAYITGSVFGGGLGLVSVCDIAIAHKDSQFCFSELKLALVPALISPFALKKIPQAKLRELMLSARVFHSAEALALNLIHFSGSAEECAQYKEALTRQLLKYDKTALKQTKKILNLFPNLSEEDQKNYAIQALAERRKSPEVFEKISLFLKSRELKKPK